MSCVIGFDFDFVQWQSTFESNIKLANQKQYTDPCKPAGYRNKLLRAVAQTDWSARLKVVKGFQSSYCVNLIPKAQLVSRSATIR